MKHTILILLAAVVLLGPMGCARRGAVVGTCASSPETCAPVGGCSDPRACRGQAARPTDPMPPNGVVTYPYYTLHGPRDFLNPNPTPLGP